MTDKEIENLYKNQLEQYYIKFLEENKTEISKLNNLKMLKDFYFTGASSSIKIINSLKQNSDEKIMTYYETQITFLTKLDKMADNFIEKNKEEISKSNLNSILLHNVYSQGAFHSISILHQLKHSKD